ncbi:MAG: hypothetical protein RLZZ221_2184 [Verrucomicrobiota bacterium]
MPAANDIRKGQVIKFNGEPHLVMETQHRTPGNLRAFVQIKMRNLRYGKALDQRFASTDTVEVLPTDRKTLEFSYADRDTYAFMDPETFEQIELTETQLGDVKNYLAPGGKVDVLWVDERPLSVDLPSTVALKVIESADGVKGDTASNVQKPAKLETGLVVQVPLFIKEGEVIRVSTLDGTYLEHARWHLSRPRLSGPPHTISRKPAVRGRLSFFPTRKTADQAVASCGTGAAPRPCTRKRARSSQRYTTGTV